MCAKKINKDKKEPRYIDKIRHSASHVLAMAVMHLYPDTKLAIGPYIDEGFYYDFKFKKPITEEDLAKIEEVAQRIIDADLPIKQIYLSKEEAIEYYKKQKQPYKLELLKEIDDKKISFYVIEGNEEFKEFKDLCRGPHVESTGRIGAFKLLSIAGAYWRGDEKNDMLTRIYGTAFVTKTELEDYLKDLEERKKRDHRVLNKRMNLFLVDKDVGAGLILWKPRGAYLRYQLMKFAFETYLKEGYVPVVTPHIGKATLWQTSGHLNYYKEGMFPAFKMDDREDYYLKPMNCPFHIKIYKSEKHSYRDLPIRYTEMGTVYRYEKAGELGGLLRVRGFTQDDAHIVCTPEQLDEEVSRALDLTMYIIKTLGDLEFDITISARDDSDKYIGDKQMWEHATNALINAVKKAGFEPKVYEGEAAFYGPKIDIVFPDASKRGWQLSTIQIDFNLPERFDMEYIGEDGKPHRPMIVHRALLGALERFIGVYLEQTGGKIPLWLQFEKVRIVPVSDKFADYANFVYEKLTEAGIESTVDSKSEPVSKKIRNAEEEMLPYVVVVGEKEKSTNSVAVRVLGHGNIGMVALDKFVEGLKHEVETKAKKSVFI